MKRCTKCGEEKPPLTAFGKRALAKDGLRNHCKACCAVSGAVYGARWRKSNPDYHAAWRKAHPESVRASSAKYCAKNRKEPRVRNKTFRKRNPESSRAGHLKRKYGLTLQAFGVLLGKQEGLCAICVGVLNPGHSTHVDHCHATSRVRGLLCHKCNTMLGLAGDKPGMLQRAADYCQRSAA